MRHLPMPEDEAKLVFLTAISNYGDEALRKRLAAFASTIESASADYVGARGDLRRCRVVKRGLVLAGVTKEELIRVYDRKVARMGQPGRPFYDRIKAAPPRGICPLCGKGPVTQLDHNFQKAVYPVLAVTPANLVPSCGDCNRRKEDVSQDASENTLHPYFHNLDGTRWLRAEVVQGTPPSVRYIVVRQVGWDDELTRRANTHLDVYGLRRLYSVEAAQEMTEIRRHLETLGAKGGKDAVREHLLYVARSREAATRNSWRTALYFALAESDWFCAEGFLLLSDT